MLTYEPVDLRRRGAEQRRCLVQSEIDDKLGIESESSRVFVVHYSHGASH